MAFNGRQKLVVGIELITIRSVERKKENEMK